MVVDIIETKEANMPVEEAEDWSPWWSEQGVEVSGKR
jgi:hypothetical protein